MFRNVEGLRHSHVGKHYILFCFTKPRTAYGILTIKQKILMGIIVFN